LHRRVHRAADTQLAKEVGADDVLAKPFTPAELVAVVERLLSDGAAPCGGGAAAG
jgi:DNA-binding response OmpR family regulator